MLAERKAVKTGADAEEPDAAASQGVPGTAWQPPQARRERMACVLTQSLGRNQPRRHFDF